MNAYLGKIAARGAGINPGPGIHMAPLRPAVFPISIPFNPPSTIPLPTGEALEPAKPTSSPTSQGLDSPSVGPLSRDALLPSMSGHGAADDLKVTSETASSSVRPSSLYELHPEGSKPKNLKVTTRRAEPFLDESVLSKAGLTGSRVLASAPESFEKKAEVELNPATREMMETSPGIRRRHPVSLNETRGDNAIQPVTTSDGTAGEPLRPVVRLEPALQPGTSLTAKQLSATGTGQDNISETGDLPNFPSLQKVSPPSSRADVRVIIGQVNVQVEMVKPQVPAPKASKNQTDPFAPLTLARRGWRGFF